MNGAKVSIQKCESSKAVRNLKQNIDKSISYFSFQSQLFSCSAGGVSDYENLRENCVDIAFSLTLVRTPMNIKAAPPSLCTFGK